LYLIEIWHFWLIGHHTFLYLFILSAIIKDLSQATFWFSSGIIFKPWDWLFYCIWYFWAVIDLFCFPEYVPFSTAFCLVHTTFIEDRLTLLNCCNWFNWSTFAFIFLLFTSNDVRNFKWILMRLFQFMDRNLFVTRIVMVHFGKRRKFMFILDLIYYLFISLRFSLISRSCLFILYVENMDNRLRRLLNSLFKTYKFMFSFHLFFKFIFKFTFDWTGIHFWPLHNGCFLLCTFMRMFRSIWVNWIGIFIFVLARFS